MNLYKFRAHRKVFVAAAGVVLLSGLWVARIDRAIAAQNQEARANEQGRAHAATRDIPKGPVMPFRAGERLNYSVSWAAFTTAAALELSIPESRDFYGWRVWHFKASAHTVSPVRALFTVDDEMDSYTDATTLESRRYETHLNELGRKEEQQWNFIPEAQTARAPGAAVVVPPGTRDPLGTLYILRSADWQNAREIRIPVYDGHHLYEVRAKAEAFNEQVEVPAGKFSSTRVAIRVFQQNKELTDVTFAMWVENDSERRPVLMRAELPFGTLRVELTSPQP